MLKNGENHMPLVKLDFDPNYRESFDGNDLKGMGVYTQMRRLAQSTML